MFSCDASDPRISADQHAVAYGLSLLDRARFQKRTELLQRLMESAQAEGLPGDNDTFETRAANLEAHTSPLARTAPGGASRRPLGRSTTFAAPHEPFPARRASSGASGRTESDIVKMYKQVYHHI